MAICPQCHHRFKKNVDNQIYCSKKCFNKKEYQRRKPFKLKKEIKMVTNDCKWCGKKVTSMKKWEKKYCNFRCYNDMLNQKKRDGYYKTKRQFARVCICGTAFISNMPRAKYCSDDCYLTYHWFRHTNLHGDVGYYVKIYIKKCPECGNLFSARYSHQMYCDWPCYNIVMGRRYFRSLMLRDKNVDYREYLKRLRVVWLSEGRCTRCGDKLPPDWHLKNCHSCRMGIRRVEQTGRIKETEGRRVWEDMRGFISNQQKKMRTRRGEIAVGTTGRKYRPVVRHRL